MLILTVGAKPVSVSPPVPGVTLATELVAWTTSRTVRDELTAMTVFCSCATTSDLTYGLTLRCRTIRFTRTMTGRSGAISSALIEASSYARRTR